MNPDLQAAAVEVRVLALMVTKLAARSIDQYFQAHHAGIGGVHYGLLRLVSHQPYTISELSRLMVLDAATLVPVVDALERQGLVERSKDPRDRRRSPLLITAQGTALIERLPFDRDDPIVRALEALGAAEANHLLALLRALATHMSGDEQMVQEVGDVIRGMTDLRRPGAAQREQP